MPSESTLAYLLYRVYSSETFITAIALRAHAYLDGIDGSDSLTLRTHETTFAVALFAWRISLPIAGFTLFFIIVLAGTLAVGAVHPPLTVAVSAFNLARAIAVFTGKLLDVVIIDLCQFILLVKRESQPQKRSSDSNLIRF